VTGPDIRKGELCMFSSTCFKKDGSLKSFANSGKSSARLAGRLVGWLADIDRRYCLLPL
jgi:hypothetical protein